MAKTLTSSSAVSGEKMPPPSITLLPDKRSPTNGHCSPVRTGKTPPSNTEKKPQINGHASPSHLAANAGNNHGGKQSQEGYMKTDDRMRLAKERREERERSLAAREQLIREKERRARLQYERTVEERWRRLEEQRQKEELRRAAVEEKRRQQLEEERERLEALMKRSLERSLQLEQRAKRWSRGCPPGAGDCENAPPPFSAASAFASPLPAAIESAPCSPHRLPFCNSLNPASPNRVGFQGGSQSTPSTPKKERVRRERRTASPGCGSPLRRSDSPASVTKYLASPTTSGLVSKVRAQSPSSPCQYHQSPTRHRPNLASGEKKDKIEKACDESKVEPVAKSRTESNGLNSPSQFGKIAANASREMSPSERRDQVFSEVDPSQKKLQSGDKESPTITSSGKVGVGTTNAEEATRLLAERRRQARAQKELEDKKREKQEKERLKDEELKKQLAQEQQRQEATAQLVEERGNNLKDSHRLKEEEDTRKETQHQKDLQIHMDTEKEKAKVQQAHEDAERHRQDRELQTQQEEEERQLRKKRIEEIMKRTRKSEADMKKEEQVETNSVSPTEDLTPKTQVTEQVGKRVEVQLREQVPAQVQTKECASLKKETAAQVDSKEVQNDNQPVRHSVPENKPDKKQTSREDQSSHKEAIRQKGAEVEQNLNKHLRTNVKVTAQMNAELVKSTGDSNRNHREGGGVNGAVKDKGGRSLDLQTSSVRQPKAGSQDVRPPVTTLPVGHLSPPVIKLGPLDVKRTGSGDEVQSMEVSPASKEELISIPEFSPINEIQQDVMRNNRALEDLIDLTGSVTYQKRPSEITVTGDCNKNLIEGVVSPMSDSKLVGISAPSSNNLSVK
ncbi:MAP7 domain-containing protein 2a isoform X2 [Nothobranchius furzeri]|uniref:MAP7 domain-containing protein 2a isoform X2 n=1 Tax=Nothobranchius furzeri TaxID=105023 RepID=UPI00077CFBF7|nr:MAP7 domain-containing protein 2a isoform X3 [Nothobranchius furzeri]